MKNFDFQGKILSHADVHQIHKALDGVEWSFSDCDLNAALAIESAAIVVLHSIVVENAEHLELNAPMTGFTLFGKPCHAFVTSDRGHIYFRDSQGEIVAQACNIGIPPSQEVAIA